MKSGKFRIEENWIILVSSGHNDFDMEDDTPIGTTDTYDAAWEVVEVYVEELKPYKVERVGNRVTAYWEHEKDFHDYGVVEFVIQSNRHFVSNG